MNPMNNGLFKCCVYYCSGIMIVGIAFFSVLMIMLKTDSLYLKPKPDDTGARATYNDHFKAVLIATIMNAVCASGCCALIWLCQPKKGDDVYDKDRPVFEAYEEDED